MARAFGAVLPLNWFGDASSRHPSNSSVGNGSESTRPTWGPRSLDGLEGVAEAGAALALRALIAGAYLALCAVGLVGNVLGRGHGARLQLALRGCHVQGGAHAHGAQHVRQRLLP